MGMIRLGDTAEGGASPATGPAPATTTPAVPGFMDGLKLWTTPSAIMPTLQNIGTIFKASPMLGIGFLAPLVLGGVLLMGMMGSRRSRNPRGRGGRRRNPRRRSHSRRRAHGARRVMRARRRNPAGRVRRQRRTTRRRRNPYNAHNLPPAKIKAINALTRKQLSVVKLNTNSVGESDNYAREAAAQYVADGGKLRDLLRK